MRIFYLHYWSKLKNFWWTRVLVLPARLRHGFWPSETWSLDCTIANFTLPRLKYLRNNSNTYPIGLCNCKGRDEGNCNDNCNGPKIWKEILDKMIWSLEFVANDHMLDEWLKDDYVYNHKDFKIANKKYEEGIVLFGKHFSSLWD